MPSDDTINSTTYSKILLENEDDGLNDLQLPPPRFDSFKPPIVPEHTYDTRIIDNSDEKALGKSDSLWSKPYFQYFIRPAGYGNQDKPPIYQHQRSSYCYDSDLLEDDDDHNIQRRSLCPCSIVSYISLITGIVLILLSLIFEFQSRYYIHKANDFEHCPTAPCITGCYKHLPFYYPPAITTLPPPPIDSNGNDAASTTDMLASSVDNKNLCTIEVKEYCDGICGDLGINAAKAYGILFMVFVSLGGFFVVLQMVMSCVKYYCLGYNRLQQPKRFSSSNKIEQEESF